MPPTGRRSNTDRLILLVAAVVVFLGTGTPARALDLFTLWRQPDISLDLTVGSRVDYRSQIMAGGRRTTDLTRVVCLPPPEGSPQGALVFEILPLEEVSDGVLKPVRGEGLWLLVSGSVADRQGDLLAQVLEAWQWKEGQSRRLSLKDLREDPLAAGTLRSEFVADEVIKKDPATRIIQGDQFLCDQFVLSARDTQSVNLPAGRMTQVTVHEVTVAVNNQLPLLGLAYAAERISSESAFETPNPRMRTPPARIRVEVMELVDFSRDASSLLGRGH